MEILLLFSLFISNIGWLIYMDRRDKREQSERTELRNREAKPNLVVPPPEILKTQVKVAEKLAEEHKEMGLPEQHEFAAVGQVNPDLMRKDNNAR